MHCRQGRHIFISIIGPPDLKYADRDNSRVNACTMNFTEKAMQNEEGIHFYSITN